MEQRNLILLTGASGYVGGRLLHSLEERGYYVRCLARRPQTVQGRAGVNTEVVFGDCFRPETLSAELIGTYCIRCTN